MSQTSHINAINLQVFAKDQAETDRANGTYTENKQADDNYYLWHGDQQTIPMGMDGEPEIFAQRLKDSLPGVNTLRLPFNEFSFNEDGSLHPEYERFLVEAVEQGFQLMLGYFGGDAQRYGFDHPDWSSDDIYNGLQTDVFPGMAEAWTKMMDWLDEHPSVKEGVYGYELANEPAAYERGVRRGDNTVEEHERFMELYADHMEALKDIIEPQGEEKILVGGWNYSAQFNDLAETMIDGVSALDLIREKIGDSLVWSAHNYPGWHGSSQSGSLEGYEALLGELYDVLGDDDVIVTELHVQGPRVDEVSEIDQPQWLASRTYEWYAERGIGGAWFPGAETGASNLVVIDAANGDGNIRYLHPGSLGHAMNLYSLDETPSEFATGDVVVSEIVEARLRNELDIVDGEPQKVFADIDGVGFAFGYEGNDTLTGHDRVNDYLYGGQDDDHLSGFGADDYLFGQYGNDTLFGGAGNDMLFGGDGDDVLEGGLGENHLEGSEGADRFILGGGGFDIIRDFNTDDGDVLVLNGEVLSFEDILRLGEAVDFQGRGVTNDFVIRHDNGGQTLILNFLSLKAGEVFDPDLLPPETGDVIGTDEADILTGTAPSQVLLGQGGDDEIQVTSGENKIYGGDGRDEIYGGSGNDSLYGGEDNDILFDRAGVNHFYGGGGNDRITVQESGAVVRSGIGNDRVIIKVQEGAVYTLSGEGGKERYEFGVQNVSSGRATITDFDDDDVIMVNGVALDLADLPDDVTLVQDVEGRLLLVSDGFEIFLLDPPIPPVPEALETEGTSGDDVVSRHLGQTSDLGDIITTFEGADTVVAGDGDDIIDTGDDRDRIVAHDGNDVVYAGGDNDEVESGLGDDLVYGGGGNDKIIAQGGSNILFGDDGNDRLIVGRGNDSAQLTGGEGSDRFEIVFDTDASGIEHVITDLDIDSDSVYLNGTLLDFQNLGEVVEGYIEGDDTVLRDDTGGLIRIQGQILDVGRRVVLGTDNADTVRLSESNVRYEALDGDDKISGSEFSDEILGQSGRDAIYGGSGGDLLFGGVGNDRIYAGSGDDALYGGTGNDRVYAGSGQDSLFGGVGNDRLIVEHVEGGEAILSGGLGKDSFEVNTGEGLSDVVITDFETHDTFVLNGVALDANMLLSESGQRSFLWGNTTVTFEGNESLPEPDDAPLRVEGTSGNDELKGGAGDDLLIGMEGDDRFANDAGSDLFYGGADKDVFFLNDATNDVAYGGEDNDRFVVHSGTATLYGGTGNDRFVFQPFGEMDVFVATGSGKDKIELTGDEQGRLTLLDFDPQKDSLYFGEDVVDVLSLDIESQTEDGTLYVFDTGFELLLT